MKDRSINWRKLYKTIEVRPDGISILSMVLTDVDKSDFIEWRAINTPKKLLSLLIAIGARRWASAWTLHEIGLATRRHFDWELK